MTCNCRSRFGRKDHMTRHAKKTHANFYDSSERLERTRLISTPLPGDSHSHHLLAPFQRCSWSRCSLRYSCSIPSPGIASGATSISDGIILKNLFRIVMLYLTGEEEEELVVRPSRKERRVPDLKFCQQIVQNEK